MPTSSTLAGFKQSFKRPTVLLDAIERHVLRQAELDDAERDMTRLHPSSLAKSKWCPLHDYYLITQPELSQGETKKFSSENIFEEGHYIHSKYHNWLRDMGVLWGRWRCEACHAAVWGQSDALGACACGASRWQYREVPLRMDSHLLIGHTDGVLITVENGVVVVRLLEIKSVGLGTVRVLAPSLFKRYTDGDLDITQLWREIQKPFGDHLRQGLLYLAMAQAWDQEIGAEIMRSIRQMVFLYEWKPTQQVKEFVVTYDEHLIKDVLDTAYATAASIRQGIPPHRPHWATQTRKPCTSCQFRTTCWSLNEPAPPPLTVRKANPRLRKRALG